LELFTDRVEEQRLLCEVLQPVLAGDAGRRQLVTVFYGVGGVGKTTLCKRAREIVEEKFAARVLCVEITFDDSRWNPGKQFSEVAAELCRCLIAGGIVPRLTVALLALHAQQTGTGRESGGGVEGRWALALDALDKGVEMAGIPGLSLMVKGAQIVREHFQRQGLRQRLNDLNLWPEEENGHVNVVDLEGKLAQSLFHDVVGWLKDNPDQHLRLLVDGFERLQSHERRDDAQRRLQELVGYFAGTTDAEACGRLRVILFGREKLRWDELYEDPGWRDCWDQHLLGGLAEGDARDFLRKTQSWLRSRGQSPLADALARNEQKILDASDERLKGQRVFYPFYLNLAVELVERARQAGSEPDLGRAPAELQDRFFRYLDKKELRALKILALSEVFDEALYDWLAQERLIDFPVHSFHTELRQEHSYIQPVEGRAGDWKFHRLFEDALHARWRSTEAERTEGIQVVRRLLDHYGGALKTKPERDWAAADVESWRRGMEIIVTQGPELELLRSDDWSSLVAASPWSTKHYRCLEYRLDFVRRILKEQERILGPEHAGTLSTLYKMGNLLHYKGDYASARLFYHRTIAGMETALGPEHPETLNCLNDLGALLFQLGDLAGAEAVFRQALVGREKILGPEDPQTLESVHNLGVLFREKGDSGGGEALLRQALEGRQKVLGPDHAKTFFTFNALGEVLLKRGDYSAAEAFYRRALEGRDRVLGPEHPDTLNSVNSLGNLLHAKGDDAGAEALYRRALEARERVLGPEHPDTLRSVYSLGKLLGDKGDYANAERLCIRAREGREKVLGAEHPDSITSVKALAGVLKAKGDRQGALVLLRERASLSSKAYSALRYNLACYECLAGNLEETKRLIAEEIAAKPQACEKALKDDDLKAIHEFIRLSQTP
jgi:tetratricopeptide (TPR) repeat protein